MEKGYSSNAFFKVYIKCYTFNQASFIQDALRGFTIQTTDFPYVCIVVDDASTDGEPDILRQYMLDYFDLQNDSISRIEESDDYYLCFARHKTNLNCYFALFLLKYNHYSIKKTKGTYFKEWSSNTEYVALCEGDDYWTDPMKLQRQIDYLDHHPDCKMCCHAVKWETDGVLYDRGCQYSNPCNLTTEEIIRNNGLYIATCSLVFRSELVPDYPEWRKVANIGDFPLTILGSLRGNLFFFPEFMGVYRFMNKDSWTSLHFGNNLSGERVSIDYVKNKVQWLTLLDKETEGKYSPVIHSLLFHYYNRLFNAREVGFWEYYRVARKADENHYGRVFKDFLIRYFNPVYRTVLRISGRNKTND